MWSGAGRDGQQRRCCIASRKLVEFAAAFEHSHWPAHLVDLGRRASWEGLGDIIARAPGSCSSHPQARATSALRPRAVKSARAPSSILRVGAAHGQKVLIPLVSRHGHRSPCAWQRAPGWRSGRGLVSRTGRTTR